MEKKTAFAQPASYLHPSCCPPRSPLCLLPPAAETSNPFPLPFSTPVCSARLISGSKSPLHQKLFWFCDCDHCLGHVPGKEHRFETSHKFSPKKHFHIAGPVQIEYLLGWPVAFQLYTFQGAFHAQACPTTYRLPAHFPRWSRKPQMAPRRRRQKSLLSSTPSLMRQARTLQSRHRTLCAT